MIDLEQFREAVRKAIQKARNVADGAAACFAQGPQHQAGMRRACNIIEAALADNQMSIIDSAGKVEAEPSAVRSLVAAA